MKKTNRITLLSFIAIIIVLMLPLLFGKSSPSTSVAGTDDSAIASDVSSNTNSEAASPDTDKSKTNPSKPVENSMESSLFIGDSRTVGLMEYSKLTGADFFANTGMTVFNIYEKTVSVPNIGKVTLAELLNDKIYDKIYLMLGINELGYNFDSIITNYDALIEYIEEKQPTATIICQANLHVTKEKSDKDKTINNNNIDKLNAAISKLAKNKNAYYLNANVIFDDENGNLAKEKSADMAHPLAKYYDDWGEWIAENTKTLIGEG